MTCGRATHGQERQHRFTRQFRHMLCERTSPRHTWRTLSIVLAIMAALGCSDPAAPEPEELSGAYVLQSMQGKPLPAVIVDDDFLFVRLMADTLRLASDGTGTWVTHFEFRLQEEPLQPFVTEFAVTYRHEDGALRVQPLQACPPEAECDALEEFEAVRRGDELSFTARYGEHRFARVGPIEQ